ncbi:unnamed protein product [Cylicostephanus goldi]|uniref:Uncharacterized protein n=1 Tax=Cylicostephanus goldi TaxID=71465 RepID=A0A3P6RH93_CYLGO|nr:unnamed protein product [Cylicostephanus goldi]
MDDQPMEREQFRPIEVNAHDLFDEPIPPASIEWQGLLPSMDNQEDMIGNELDKIKGQLKSLTNAV